MLLKGIRASEGRLWSWRPSEVETSFRNDGCEAPKRGEADAVRERSQGGAATGSRWGRGSEAPPPVQSVTRICAMTSEYSVSPTGSKPTRRKNASGPPSPAS